MTVYVGEVHSNAFGIGNVGTAPVHGEFRGQDVTLNPKTKSLIEQASEMDDYVVVRRKQTPKLKDRKVCDKKRVAGHNRLLTQFVNRLDRRQQNQEQSKKRYQDCENKLMRLKQKASNIKQSLEGNGEDLKLDGQKLSELILEEMSESFPDVTEQDNIIEYLESLEDLGTGEAESEIRQANKFIKRLEGNTDEKSVSKIEDLKQKVNDLEKQIKFSVLFKRELAEAKQNLRGLHGEEIKDGYNLIPKATSLFSSLVQEKDSKGDFAFTVATAYQDALCKNSLSEVVQSSFSLFGSKNWEKGLGSMLELSGADIQSINPSREPQFLMSVRELLFRVEIAMQLFSSIVELRSSINNLKDSL